MAIAVPSARLPEMPGGEGCPVEAMNDGSVRALAASSPRLSRFLKLRGCTVRPGEYQPARPCRSLREHPGLGGPKV
jgi:hypothetical protein